ncbi:phosphoribosylaminoimidazolesuccinocarboxamide synthase [Isachenkonia alkalipeptolytica]|uniref:Phosphoribosylaminoimidazole-succinocarboxamide synthase n=1 Tax=Isachenkonia alkalipeptolytica TaxID=2565777 RepID=A0AA43XJD6_9CLOT|nr:phosphoribosylaminoimidazolesuccinocarboxamide synthase [Isachenkonia alkalipeptolytica]
MTKGTLLYEGKAKRVYETKDKDCFIVSYKTDATAFDGKKKGSIEGKDRVNNLMSARLFEVLEEKGIETHFVKVLEEHEMVVKRLEIIPVEVIVRNVAAGGMAKKLGLKEGTPLGKPVVEYCLKSDELSDPMINEDHIEVLELADKEEIQTIRKMALKINQVLKAFFLERELNLVDFKLEFGRYQGRVILGDEISPDTCRLWDLKSGERLDKDRFRRDLGAVEESYLEVLKRVTGMIN